MANTKEDISKIHAKRLATPGKKYYRDDDEVFIGTEDKKLKVLKKEEVYIKIYKTE